MTALADSLTPELLDRIRAGDPDAFERLFRAWYGRLADHAARMLGSRDAAEDAVQEVFVAVWHRRESLPDPAMVPAYLFRAVRNRALNELRRGKTADRHLTLATVDPVAPAGPATDLVEAEIARQIREAVDQLSPRCREVFLLSRDDGLSYPEIAHTLGISVKTVETLMGRALKSLRARLADLRPPS